MTMKIQTGVKAHDDTCQAAEMTRQVAVKAAGNSQSAVTAAEITYYKAVRDSARTNGLPGVGDFNTVIIQLGGKA
jgi:hypothetical protein